MSFLNPDKDDQGSRKVHVRSYSWSGGEKAIDPNNLAAGKKAYAEIRYYEGSGQSMVKGKAEIPMKLAVLGTTFQVTGYSKGATEGSDVAYFSNETVEWGQELIVYKRDTRGIEVVARGSYKDVKEALGDNIKCQHNVYFYDTERDCIDRFCFKGSSYGEWTTYKKSIRREIYTAFTTVSEGEATEFPTGVAILPKFTLADETYTERELEKITKFAEEYEEYEKYLTQRSNEVPQDAYDQTPAHYDGEGSQELPEASADQQDSGAINLDEIPF